MTNDNRQPAGSLVGGEFATKNRAEADIALGGSPDITPLAPLRLNHHTRSLEHFTGDNRRDRFIMNQPYQRGSVWDETRRRNLIKSLLLGLPIGAIVTNDRGYQADNAPDTAIIDGKQRVEALWAFVDSELPIPAGWLDARFVEATEPMNFEGHTVDGVRFRDTSLPFQRKFTNCPISALEAQLPGERDEAEVFVLINAGGIAQDEETIQKARELS